MVVWNNKILMGDTKQKFVVFCAARDKVSKLLNAARDGNLQTFKGNQILFFSIDRKVIYLGLWLLAEGKICEEC